MFFPAVAVCCLLFHTFNTHSAALSCHLYFGEFFKYSMISTNVHFSCKKIFGEKDLNEGASVFYLKLYALMSCMYICSSVQVKLSLLHSFPYFPPAVRCLNVDSSKIVTKWHTSDPIRSMATTKKSSFHLHFTITHFAALLLCAAHLRMH